MTKKSKGFTLIELLITITIIAILSAIALVSYTTFMKNSRDARRQSDLKFIQSALEQYHADLKYYPNSQEPDLGCKDGLFVLDCPLKSPDSSKEYLSKVPNDPKGYPPYCYIGSGCDTAGCQTYTLYTFLENSGVVPEISGCSITQPVFNFEVKRP